MGSTRFFTGATTDLVIFLGGDVKVTMELRFLGEGSSRALGLGSGFSSPKAFGWAVRLAGCDFISWILYRKSWSVSFSIDDTEHYLAIAFSGPFVSLTLLSSSSLDPCFEV